MKTFSEFWKFYLSQHTNNVNITLHVLGTLLGISAFVYALIFDLRIMLLAPVITYSFAWFGHFVFEKNKPATFKYPFRSILGDFKLTFITLKSFLKFNS